MKKLNVFIAILTILAVLSTVSAEDIRFPSDVVVNVTAGQYGVVNDGATDVTAELTRAIGENIRNNPNVIIYLPKGVYLVSDQLFFNRHVSRVVIQGESRDSTIIRLKDSSASFQPLNQMDITPKGVVWLGSTSLQRYRNSIRNLTIDVGRKNPKASAIQFDANAQGSIRKVTLLGENNNSGIGIDLGSNVLSTTDNGPLLIKDALIKGFYSGIVSERKAHSAVIENVILQDQTGPGIINRNFHLTVRNLEYTGEFFGIYNSAENSVMTLVDAVLKRANANAPDIPAIYNRGFLFARDIKAEGYDTLIKNDSRGDFSKSVVSDTINEFVSHGPYRLGASSAKSLRLQPLAVPDIPRGPPDQWASPQEFGARADGRTNDAPALQQAIDAGKSTVYFTGGKTYFLGASAEDTIYIRGSVRSLIGLESRVIGNAVFCIEEGVHSEILFEGLESAEPFIDNKRIPLLRVLHKADRTVIFKSVMGLRYKNVGSQGDVFFEDYSYGESPTTPGVTFMENQRVYGRQMHFSGNNIKIENNGALLWILGLSNVQSSSFDGGVLVKTANGGKTEILGSYTNAVLRDSLTPMYYVENGCLSLAGHGGFSSPSNTWKVLVREFGENMLELMNDDVPQRRGTGAITLFVSENSTANGHEAPATKQSRTQVRPNSYAGQSIVRALSQPLKLDIPLRALAIKVFNLHGQLIWSRRFARNKSNSTITIPSSASLSGFVIISFLYD
ncbi:MAG: hypothetical protein GF398_01365 [Chitinivibrionales bacterium]|nr:hypothetical protein [Chitinivibrionales bacterium]